jgi:putative molybdopterin biosynthesis protein
LAIYASHDDALVMLRETAAAQSLHLDLRFCGSVDAIRALNEGRCHVAGFHAPWQPDAHSLVARTYKPLLKPGLHKLIGFATRAQGLMVAPGNPWRLQSLVDVAHAKVRYVNRSPGTGTRLLLDQCLQVLGLQTSDLKGYAHEENSHTAVAACIAAGQADAGLGIASAAQLHGLDFVSLYPERYWLVCLASALESAPVRQLRDLLSDPAWLGHLQAMAGYTTNADAGQVQSLRSMLPWWQFRSVRDNKG